MKILYVATDIKVPGTSGGATHVSEVVNILRKKHDVLLFAEKGSEGAGVCGIGQCNKPGLRVIYPLFLLSEALKIAMQFKPDIICERSSSFGLGALLSKKLSTPLAVEVNDKKVDSFLNVLSFKQAKKIYSTHLGLIPKRFLHKAVKVNWGANTEKFNPQVSGAEVRKKFGIEGKKVIGYLGSFGSHYSWYGVDDILRVAKRLEDNKNLLFVIVGGGKYERKIKKLAHKLDLKNVILTGKVPYSKAPKYIALFDIALAPYKPSGHPTLKKLGIFYNPIKVFEYMASGKPVITVRSGNLLEMFEHKRTAYLIEPENLDQLASAVKELVSNEELASQIAKSGRELVQKNYGWEAHCKDLERIFCEVLNNRMSKNLCKTSTNL